MTYFEESRKRGERNDEWMRFDEQIRKTPLIERLAQVDIIINELSRDGRPPKTSIPAQPTDEDVFINFTLSHVAEVLKSETTWTTEFPTKPGFYWIREWITKYDDPHRPIDGGVHVVELRPSALGEPPGTLMVEFAGDSTPMGQEEFRSAEWYGPIEPPE